MTSALSCWVLSDGRRGIENQALGLAEACGHHRPLDIQTFTLNSKSIFKALPPKGQRLFKSSPAQFGLPSALPDLVIGCGRQAIAPLIVLKKAFGPKVFTTYIQDPRLAPTAFDLVIAPEHDAVRGANVETMIGSPNRITKSVLDIARSTFENELHALKSPKIAVLVGGPSKAYTTGGAIAAQHLKTLSGLAESGCALMISLSRRTPDDLRRPYSALAKQYPNIWLYDGIGPNPYFAFLAQADAVLVTEDSTNMLTEACATGAPVFRLPMATIHAKRAQKFAKLHAQLSTRCHVTQAGSSELILSALRLPQAYSPLQETDRIAKIVWSRFESSRTD